MDTTFMLADTLYVKANIPPTETVCLWLGVCDCYFVCIMTGYSFTRGLYFSYTVYCVVYCEHVTCCECVTKGPIFLLNTHVL